MTPWEYADKHERRLTTAHSCLLKGFTDGQEELKLRLREEIEKSIAETFRAEQDGGKEYYPFDSMSLENLVGMKRAYQHILLKIDLVTPKP